MKIKNSVIAPVAIVMIAPAATAAEINVLDGVTASTAEINYLDVSVYFF